MIVKLDRTQNPSSASLRKVHELDPYSVFYYAIHGQTLYQAGRFEDSGAKARKAIALNANSWIGHFILGKNLIESSDLQGALAELQQAFELSGGLRPLCKVCLIL